jgi:hypothetical protein
MRLALTTLTAWLLALAAQPARAGDSGRVLARDALQPQVTVDPKGNVYVVFLQKGNVAVCVSTDRGKTFGPPVVAIDAKGKAAGGRQRGPRIGADAKGNLVVTCPLTFDLKEAARKYPTRDLYLVTSADGGKSWSPPLRVNEVPQKAPEALHWLAVAPDGEAHVAWLDRRDRGREPGQDLYYARVSGGKVSKNVPVARLVCECCAPGLAVDGRGNPLVTYREGGNKPSRELFALRSGDRGASFAKAVRLNTKDSTESGCPMSAPAAAVSADGKKFAAAWMDKRGGADDPNVFWAVSDSPAFGKDALLHDRTRGVQDHPGLAIDAKGTVWAVWEDARSGQQRIWVRSSAPGDRGRELSGAADGPAAYPAVACNAGLVAVVYEGRPGGTHAVLFRLLTP